MIEKDREKVLRQGIEEGFYPRYLYKYWSFESAKRFLETGKIKYSAFHEFNDPFEASFGLIGNATEEEKKMFLKTYLPDALKDMNSGIIPFEDIKMYISKTIHDSLNCIGIFCLTQTNQDLLMWAHYAHEHEGVCLKFDLLQDTRAFSSLHKVVYSTEYLNFNLITDFSRVNDILVHKSVDWMYENEYRVLKINEVGLGSVNPEALVEIVFGCRMNQANKETIKSIIADNPNYKINFKQAGMHSNDYRILICDEDDKSFFFK